MNVMDCTVGLEDKTKNENFYFYPNPSPGNFAVTTGGESAGSRLVVTDLAGRTVYVTTLENDRAVIDTRLQKGMYFCRQETAGGSAAVKKIVVD